MKNMYELKVLVNFNEVSFHTFSVGNELEALNNLIGSLERSGVKIVASDDVLLELRLNVGCYQYSMGNATFNGRDLTGFDLSKSIYRLGVIEKDDSYRFLTYTDRDKENALLFGMEYVCAFYSNRMGDLKRLVSDYSFADYRLNGLWFFAGEHCFKDACD